MPPWDVCPYSHLPINLDCGPMCVNSLTPLLGSSNGLRTQSSSHSILQGLLQQCMPLASSEMCAPVSQNFED